MTITLSYTMDTILPWVLGYGRVGWPLAIAAEVAGLVPLELRPSQIYLTAALLAFCSYDCLRQSIVFFSSKAIS